MQAKHKAGSVRGVGDLFDGYGETARGLTAAAFDEMVGLGDATRSPYAAVASSLSQMLYRELGRVVVDKTGLTGRYDCALKWTPDNGTPPNGDADAAPPIFTAIQEQLGLKLESSNAPVKVLVIDHLEMPTEN